MKGAMVPSCDFVGFVVLSLLPTRAIQEAFNANF
jgi:hypothetical protein